MYTYRHVLARHMRIQFPWPEVSDPSGQGVCAEASIGQGHVKSTYMVKAQVGLVVNSQGSPARRCITERYQFTCYSTVERRFSIVYTSCESGCLPLHCTLGGATYPAAFTQPRVIVWATATACRMRHQSHTHAESQTNVAPFASNEYATPYVMLSKQYAFLSSIGFCRTHGGRCQTALCIM